MKLKEKTYTCPIGTHFVRSHRRKTGSGYSVIGAHCRKNPKGKEGFLFKSNLDYIFEDFKSKYKYEELRAIKKFPQDKGQYDELIQFWLNYWKDQNLIKDDIDPLLVKAMIAVESGFREKIVTKMPNSSATGLMQILVSTMQILSKKLSTEIKKYNIDISQEEARHANSNIAAGTRWLIHKVKTSPWRNKKSKEDRVYGGIKYYHSWDSEGEKYADKVFKVYHDSK